MALDEGGGKRGDSKRAAFDAYAEHLEPFHNWLLKNTFQVAPNALLHVLYLLLLPS